jgi:cytochrome P450
MGLILTVAAAFGLSLALWVVVDWIRYIRWHAGGFYWPVVGHLPSLLANRHDLISYFRHFYKREGFPDVALMKCFFLESPRFLVITPKDVEHILKTKFENYHISVGLRGDNLRDFLGDGIFNADGHMWLLQRKLAAREFSANRFRTFMSEVFHRAALKLTRVLESEVNAAPKGQRAVVDMHQWFFTLTLDAFSEIAFGLDLGGLDGKPQPFIQAFDKCQAQCFNRCEKHSGIWKLMKLLNLGPERDMKKALKVIDDFVYSLMDDLLAGTRQLHSSTHTRDGEEEEKAEDDLLRRLLPAAKKDDGSYDRVLVRDMLLSLVIAGRDTTAASMSWTMWELMKNPQCVDAILEELDTATGPQGHPTFDNVAGCHYLQAVLSESQRLHPSVPFEPRTALEADVLPFTKIPVEPGQTVGYCNYASGISPKIWGPDAAEFKPTRWIEADGTCRKEDQYKFPAFNGGRRLCLGMDMANLEMKVVLGVLLRKFRFELVPGQNVICADALTLQMAHGVKAYITRR